MDKEIENILKEERKKFKGSDEEFEKLIDKKLPPILENVTRDISKELLNYVFDNNNDLKKHDKKTLKSIKSKYGNAINIFEAFIELNCKIVADFHESSFEKNENVEDQIKLDTLISIHVRACQISNEIRTLIINGYADGAFSRWRTLHELCVTFLFLNKNEYIVTEMYNDYQAIENWKKVKEFQEHHKSLDWEPFSKEDIDLINEDRQEMIKKYGKEFSQSYGWTIRILPKGQRNIREIENSVNQQHFRPVYAWASENVHSGVSAIRKKLGLREHEQDYLLTYSNDFGFAETVEFTTKTLAKMTQVFLNMQSGHVNNIIKELLNYLQNSAIENFYITENLNRKTMPNNGYHK